MMSYIELDEEKFAKITAEGVSLVDFWAPWCQPCMMLSPVIEEVADELDGEVNVCKVNCDEQQQLAMLNGVMSIPCMILYVDGEEKERLVGLNSKEDIIEFINENK
ncbi:MAG: thioredoxin [Clostridia bacterium]